MKLSAYLKILRSIWHSNKVTHRPRGVCVCGKNLAILKSGRFTAHKCISSAAIMPGDSIVSGSYVASEHPIVTSTEGPGETVYIKAPEPQDEVTISTPGVVNG